MKKSRCRKNQVRLSFDPEGRFLAFLLNDQEYRLDSSEPYQRRDLEPSAVLTWITTCPNCGILFSLKTGRLFQITPKRRCDNCRQPGIRVD